jgi:hypothetical protein
MKAEWAANKNWHFVTGLGETFNFEKRLASLAANDFHHWQLRFRPS